MSHVTRSNFEKLDKPRSLENGRKSAYVKKTRFYETDVNGVLFETRPPQESILDRGLVLTDLDNKITQFQAQKDELLALG